VRRRPARGIGLPEVTGVVLAGGRSSRFGRNKLLEPYGGTPMLHRVVVRLAEVCGEVVVVIAPAADEPPMPLGVDVRFARDAVEGDGPLAGTHAGLLDVRTPYALLCAGDMPDLQTAVLLEMLRVADEIADGADGVALLDDRRVRPLPCVLRVGPATEAAHALLHDGSRRLRDLLDASRIAAIDEASWTVLDPARRTLFDVDDPSDLER
jgi:molybdopterin-guanine dinucleotide biosynthesis protein A